jgi:hypothetical protein
LVTKTIKTFLATYRPARGLIRVVIVKEDHGCEFFFCTDPNATPREILEAFGDRAAIEQDFHDVKEVWGAGQQQVRNLWTNVAVFNLNLWVHTLVEGWAWHKPAEELRDRSRPPLRGGARPGTPPRVARLTPIAAKPCAVRPCTTNICLSPPSTVLPQTSVPSTNAC